MLTPRLLILLMACVMSSCNHAARQEETAGKSGSASSTPPAPHPLKAQPERPSVKDEEFSFYRDTTLLFGKYIIAHDDEGYASVFYKPSPDSAWAEIPQVYGRSVELDTANVDRQGEPELLLTIEYKRSGSAAYGTVQTLYVLRPGPTLDSLLAVRTECSDWYHAWEDGELYSFGQTQQVTAGYGFICFGPVRATCERSHSTAPCECDAQDLAEAGGVPFARPGRYRWQRGRLAWVGSR
ncbi:hypothetical protein ACFST9_15680 [Hymenobacter monticola]|uniref:Lipoprotein n=1 Tax=Hymenobacter monticola TaxID=1705399 RepID=A0ABY4B1E8_9BACT|nr:hypothetical protein [Hymenobacter monticola]UOE32649.1 hypothetical protein MTP16_16105 [Hymenobacter monticola]